MPNAIRILPIAVLAALAVGLPGAGRADTPVLNAEVGAPTSPNAFRITLTDAGGAKVTQLDPGTYTIVVHDYADEHNFHLFGPGVDQATDVAGTGTVTWTVTIKNGLYTFVCDAHPASMKGTFFGGTPPAAPGRLNGRVGPRRTISLRSASGARVRTVAAGRWKIVVRDATAVDNFHLVGPGVNRRTGVRARGTSSWTVALSKGTYRYFSDRHRTLRGSFTVVAKPPIA